MPADPSDPFHALSPQFLPFLDITADGSHDATHLQRVWQNVKAIQREEGGNLKILAAAVWLHDCVTVEKSSPLRPQASRLSAEKASEILASLHWDPTEIDHVTTAIATHSFSAGLAPTTLEARILQDADRLDAIGLAGIARCFYTAGRMGSSLYHSDDPEGPTRELDDRRYALDHFPLKLLRLASSFQTAVGARLAEKRHTRVYDFYRSFLEEISSA